MPEPIKLDALLAEEFDTVEVEVELLVPDETDETEPIDEHDLAPAPEFADFDAWCDWSNEWAAVWRPEPTGPWICRNCGAEGHRFRDHEGGGA
jgi:hypothetical protein